MYQKYNDFELYTLFLAVFCAHNSRPEEAEKIKIIAGSWELGGRRAFPARNNQVASSQ
jgi:hypothetical protein